MARRNRPKIRPFKPPILSVRERAAFELGFRKMNPLLSV
jgi:hypothetical protein